MLSKKNLNQNDSINRLRDLLSQLETAQHDSDDLTLRARHEVGRAIRGSGLTPAPGSTAAPLRKKKAGKKKR